MRKLIYFDSLVLENENDEIKHRLYDLFFIWRQKEHKNLLSEKIHEENEKIVLEEENHQVAPVDKD